MRGATRKSGAGRRDARPEDSSRSERIRDTRGREQTTSASGKLATGSPAAVLTGAVLMPRGECPNRARSLTSGCSRDLSLKSFSARSQSSSSLPCGLPACRVRALGLVSVLQWDLALLRLWYDRQNAGDRALFLWSDEAQVASPRNVAGHRLFYEHAISVARASAGRAGEMPAVRRLADVACPAG